MFLSNGLSGGLECAAVSVNTRKARAKMEIRTKRPKAGSAARMNIKFMLTCMLDQHIIFTGR